MFAPTAFWDRLANRYAAQPIADEAAYQTKLATTRRYLAPEMTLFEFGCGTGSTALLHAPYVRHIRAIDFSARMVAIARAKAEAAGISNVSFEQASIETVDLAPASLDMALGLSILHLLHDKAAAIAKIHAALKPGGLFVSSTACIREATPFLRFIAPITNRIGIIPYLDVMTGDQLVAAIEEHNFTLVHRWQPRPDAALFLIFRK